MSSNGRTWYAEMCRRPEWQQKRLKILERDKWECQSCPAGEGKEKTLVVHHRYYFKGRLPWEYPDEALVTFCETCHEYMKDDPAGLIVGLTDVLFKRFGDGALENLIYLLTEVDDKRLSQSIASLHVPVSKKDKKKAFSLRYGILT